jgi:hypothetical protein
MIAKSKGLRYACDDAQFQRDMVRNNARIISAFDELLVLERSFTQARCPVQAAATQHKVYNLIHHKQM